jgi:hypothetical protein
MMTAVVTHKKEEFSYTIENVTTVNYVENALIIVALKDNMTNTYTYLSKDVIVAIA